MAAEEEAAAEVSGAAEPVKDDEEPANEPETHLLPSPPASSTPHHPSHADRATSHRLLLGTATLLLLLFLLLLYAGVPDLPALSLPFSLSPSTPPLPSTTVPSTAPCVIPLYSHDDSSQLYELQWVTHYLVSSLPSHCSRRCVVRWRPWASFESDYTSLVDNPTRAFQPQPHLHYPMIWTGWRDDLSTIGRFCSSAGAGGCGVVPASGAAGARRR